MNSTRTLRFSTLGMIVLAGSLTVPAAQPPRPATVADFTMQLAVALGFEPASPAEARTSLLYAGVDVGDDLDASLTRQRAAGFLTQAGLRSETSSDPGWIIPAGGVGQLAARAAEVLLATPTSYASVTALAPACFTLPRNECTQCCVQALLGLPQFPAQQLKACAANCRTTPPPSQSGP